MLNLDDYLSKDQQEFLLEGLYQNKYSLILGAGASAESLNVDDEPIPVASGLARLINQEYNLGFKPDEMPGLNILFGLASDEVKPAYPRFRDFLNKKFTCNEYSPFYEKILNFRWNYVWNLNIDDCLEKTYIKYSGDVKHNFRHLNFTDNYQEKNSTETFHIHLHGKVGSIEDNAENIIFTIEQYQNYIESNNTWLKRFNDVYPGAPTIALGATLHSESDLNRILLDKAKYNSDYPSVIVLRSVSEPMKRYYRKKLNLIAIEADVETFIDCLKEKFDEYLSSKTDPQKDAYFDMNLLDSRILHNWRNLKKHTPVSDDLDIYEGYEPDWDDALNKYLSTRQQRDEIFRLIQTDSSKKFVFMTGPAFSGKTALLYSVAFQAVSQNKNVYFFDFNHGKLGHDDILSLIDNKNNLLLCFDNSVDIFDKIVDLYQEVDDKKNVTFIVTSRAQRAESALNNVTGVKNFTHFRLQQKLGLSERESLFEKLTTNLALHNFQGQDFEVVDEFFKQHHYNIFSAMAGLSLKSSGFDARIDLVLGSVNLKKYKVLLLVIALTNSIGLNLPKEVLVSITGLNVSDIDFAVSDEIAEIVDWEDNSIRFHHKYMSESVLKKFDKVDVLESLKKILIQVSRYVTPETMSDRNVYYAIARSLMRFENINKLTSQRIEDAIDFYEEVTPYYKNNSRFWDQKALALASGLQFKKAFGSAYNSLNIEGKRHPFALNTLATVKFKYILYMMDQNKLKFDIDSYAEACDSLQEAFESSKRISEYPINTFISYTKDIIRNPMFDRNINSDIVRRKLVYWNIKLIDYESAVANDRYQRIITGLNDIHKFLNQK